MEAVKKTIKVKKKKKDEYLLDIADKQVLTTYNVEYAYDISNWSLEQVGLIVSSLRDAGYKKIEILTIGE